MDNIIKKCSSLISIIFHPVFMTFFTICLIIFTQSDLSYSYLLNNHKALALLLIAFFVQTALLPIGLMYYLKSQKIISDLYIQNANQRQLPYILIISIYSFLCFSIGQKTGYNSLLIIALIHITTSIFIVFLINFYIKISSHAVGVAGACGLFWMLYLDNPNGTLFWICILLTILVGLVSSARLILKVHSILEINLGIMVGFIIGFLTKSINFNL